MSSSRPASKLFVMIFPSLSCFSKFPLVFDTWELYNSKYPRQRDNRSWKSAGEKRQGLKRRDKQAMKGNNKADRNSENKWLHVACTNVTHADNVSETPSISLSISFPFLLFPFLFFTSLSIYFSPPPLCHYSLPSLTYFNTPPRHHPSIPSNDHPSCHCDKHTHTLQIHLQSHTHTHTYEHAHTHTNTHTHNYTHTY